MKFGPFFYVALFFAASYQAFAEAERVERVMPPLLQTQVKGLLIITLPDGSHAGAASQMNATVVPAKKGEDFNIRFNQEVGKMMSAATKEVTKLMRVRHADQLPVGNVIELGFADKHTLKDGPSAAVASALMANAIITGEKLDQTFAATGDMTATGEVRRVGGVSAKIRGASRKGCRIFAVPKGNLSAISDLYVSGGVKAVCQIQIIAVENFDQAVALSLAEKNSEVEAALADFELVKKAVMKNVANAGHSKVRAKLKSILEVIPNHESARLVALHGVKKGPKRLSLAGSLHEIDQAADELVGILRAGNYQQATGSDELWSSMARMDKLRKAVDSRTKDYLDAFLNTADFIKKRRERKYYNEGEKAQFHALVRSINSAKEDLRKNQSVQEELLAE